MQDIKDSFSEWFSMLNDSQLKLVKSNSVILNYTKGETICKQGAFASNVYFVEDGFMKAYKEYKDGYLIMRFVQKNMYSHLRMLVPLLSLWWKKAVHV